MFFRWDDRQPEAPDIEQVAAARCLYHWPSEMVQEYNQHLQEYWKRLGDTVRGLRERWRPHVDCGLPQPSTFVGENRRLKEGDLVYLVEYNGARLLRPVCIPRLRYKYCRQELLPEHLKYCQDVEQLCPACRVFGWVKKLVQQKQCRKEEPEQAPPGERVAWAGRVNFSHAEIEGCWQEEAEIPLAVLSTPKPTTTAFYLLDGQGKPCALVNYDWPDARLRGRKFYRHHGRADEREYKRENRDGQNRTVRGAIKPGAEFGFTVDFTNLTPLELGALLYVLELEEGMVHRLGYAKPLGFGSIKLSVERLEMIDWRQRLASPANNVGWQDVDREKLGRLKQQFLKEMARLYGNEWADVLADLKALLGSPPALPVHYPRPTRRFNPKHPQFEWFVGNKKRREWFVKKKHSRANSAENNDPVTLPLARQDTVGLPLIDKKGD